MAYPLFQDRTRPNIALYGSGVNAKPTNKTKKTRFSNRRLAEKFHGKRGYATKGLTERYHKQV